jgi:lipid II:glycine glycyltransferase (peptidoglycan interpeptide bridge formation enzyme)
MALQSVSEWENYLASQPAVHVLQTAAWGELKAGFGWEVCRLRKGETGCQVLFRRLPFGLRIAYIPKGPLGADWSSLQPELDDLCRRKRAVFLKLEPDAWAENAGALPVSALADFQSSQPIQPRQTVVVDLRGTEEDWLGRMKPKTRYNIRLSTRKGVTVRETNELADFHQLMTITGNRDGFGVHSRAYYQKAFELFHPGGNCALLQAEFDGKPLAALMVFQSKGRAWYFYGASSDEERSRMPAYLLQWEAMRWSARQGCYEYDLWGIPDFNEEKLEAEFETQSGGLWGVYRFKRGFGGSLRRSAGAWDKVYNPLLYRFYLWYMQRRSPEGM